MTGVAATFRHGSPLPYRAGRHPGEGWDPGLTVGALRHFLCKGVWIPPFGGMTAVSVDELDPPDLFQPPARQLVGPVVLHMAGMAFHPVP